MRQNPISGVLKTAIKHTVQVESQEEDDCLKWRGHLQIRHRETHKEEYTSYLEVGNRHKISSEVLGEIKVMQDRTLNFNIKKFNKSWEAHRQKMQLRKLECRRDTTIYTESVKVYSRTLHNWSTGIGTWQWRWKRALQNIALYGWYIHTDRRHINSKLQTDILNIM